MCQRSIFYWLNTGELSEKELMDKGHQQISTEEIAQNHGVPKDIFDEYLQTTIELSESCRSLPFTLLLVISYAVVAILHDDASVVNAVEDSISFDIEENANFAWSGPNMGHKGFHDVNSHADFWSWTVNGFIPLLFTQEYGFHEGANSSKKPLSDTREVFYRQDRGLYLHYNKILGGIRMSQELPPEPPELPCESKPEELFEVYGLECIHGKGYELEPEMFRARVTVNPQRVEWLWINEDVDIVQDKLRQMEGSQWLDRKTGKIEIMIPIYNAEYGLWTLVYVDFFFSRGGHIFKDIICLSNYANWHPKSFYYGIDFIWIICLLYIIVGENLEMYTVISKRGVKAVFTEYANFWNTIDWFSVFGGAGILTMFYYNLAFTAMVNMAGVELTTVDEARNTKRYREYAKLLIAEIEKENHYCQLFRLLMAGYPLIVVFRLFKAYSSQPRLALVTSTMAEAAVDLLHFLLVFVTVFASYAIAGVALFGREVGDFTTFQRAINCCFRAMLGDFDWDDLSSIGRAEAGIWFWTFMILISMLMLNMLLAIVMDAYSEVKAANANKETLWAAIKAEWKRSRGLRKKELVPLRKVETAMLDKLAGPFPKVRIKIPKGEKTETEEEAPAEEEDDLGLGLGGPETGAKAVMSLDDLIASKKQEGTREIEMVTFGWISGNVENIRPHQTLDLLQSAVEKFHDENVGSADSDELNMLMRQMDYRSQKWRNRVAEKMISGHLRQKMKHSREAVAELFRELPHSATAEGMSLPSSKHTLAAFAVAAIEIAAEEVRMHAESEKGPPKVPIAEMHHLREGGRAQLLKDKDRIIHACHRAGIGTENDDFRKRAAGRVVHVVQKDLLDDTVKVHVHGIGDLWFGIGAFAKPKVDDTSNEAKRAAGPTAEEKAALTAAESAAKFHAMTLQHRRDDLKREVEELKDVSKEAMEAISEMHLKLSRKNDGNSKVDEVQDMLKSRMSAFVQENKTLREEDFRREGQLQESITSRNQYFDLLNQASQENHELKKRWAELQEEVDELEEASEKHTRHWQAYQEEREAQLAAALRDAREMEEAGSRAYAWLAARVESLARNIEVQGRLPDVAMDLQRLRSSIRHELQLAEERGEIAKSTK